MEEEIELRRRTDVQIVVFHVCFSFQSFSCQFVYLYITSFFHFFYFLGALREKVRGRKKSTVRESPSFHLATRPSLAFTITLEPKVPI